jgi:hypothetical protein
MNAMKAKITRKLLEIGLTTVSGIMLTTSPVAAFRGPRGRTR